MGFFGFLEGFSYDVSYGKTVVDPNSLCADNVTSFSSSEIGTGQGTIVADSGNNIQISVFDATSQALILPATNPTRFIDTITSICNSTIGGTSFIFGPIATENGYPGDAGYPLIIETNGNISSIETFTTPETNAAGNPIGPKTQTVVVHLTRNPDRDLDGVPDATDACPDTFGTLPNGCLDTTDTDGDGVPDTIDNCRTTPNANQADLDHDGLGDACDPDIDGDTVPNATDNCPTTANTNQANLDGDALGDACDPDIDGDGQPNATDPCPLDATNACASPHVSISPICVPHFTTVSCTLSSTATGGIGPFNYLWSFGDGTPNQAGPSAGHIFARKPAGVDALIQPTDTVVLTVTDATGKPATVTLPVAVGNPWRPLILAAVLDLDTAIQLDPGSTTVKGYYAQVVNLLCAAGKSFRRDCQPMVSATSNYTAPGLKPTAQWAGEWVWDIFNNFLDRDITDAASVADVQNLASKLAPLLCPSKILPIPLCGTLISQSDIAAAIAGALHFANNLNPSFKLATELALQKLGPGVPSVTSLRQLFNNTPTGIRVQHEALFSNAVDPGFTADLQQGLFSPVATAVAKLTVPRVAGCVREQSIKLAFEQVYGTATGDSLYLRTTGPNGPSPTSPFCTTVGGLVAALP